MTQFLYFDFEYRNNENEDAILMMAFLLSTDSKPQVIDLRDSAGRDRLKNIVNEFSEYTWVAYNVLADLTCLNTLDIDIRPLSIIDAMVEARMITLTHPNFQLFKPNLIDTLAKLRVQTEADSQEKDGCRDLILGQDTYSNAEWNRIKKYCKSDITLLSALLSRCWDIHKSVQSPLKFEEMVTRGEYLKQRLLLDLKTRGFPVDTEMCRQLSLHKDDILRDLQLDCNDRYGELYRDTGKATLTWSQQGFQELITTKKLRWERTATGKPVTSQDYFKQQSKRYPDLYPLYQVRKTISTVRGTDLHGLIVDGHIKPPLYPFAQKASRENHRPTKGFILGLPSWQRCLIKPRPGNVIIAADWAQQEIAIAGALSGDRNYLDLYNDPSGDVYLALANKADAIRPEMSPEEIKTTRDMFKMVQLGLGYGKGLKALTEDIFVLRSNDQKGTTFTQEQANGWGRHIFNWHKTTLAQYWRWIEKTIADARRRKYLRSSDGWTYFVDPNIQQTKLINFPMQANGAAMLRRAVMRCYETQDIDLVCTMHDALYITCHEDDQDKQVELLEQCMNDACHDILGDVVKIRIDTQVYNSETGYQSSRGTEMMEQVKQHLTKYQS